MNGIVGHLVEEFEARANANQSAITPIQGSGGAKAAKTNKIDQLSNSVKHLVEEYENRNNQGKNNSSSMNNLKPRPSQLDQQQQVRIEMREFDIFIFLLFPSPLFISFHSLLHSLFVSFPFTCLFFQSFYGK